MPSVTWVNVASSRPMGQQAYEDLLQAGVRALAPADWQFNTLRVTSLRSGVRGATRIPMGPLSRLPLPAVRLAGQMLYGGADLVHRLDLRVPPRSGLDIVTVLDLSPLHFNDEGTISSQALRGAAHASGVLCPSEATAAEVRDVIGPRRTWVLPQAAEPGFSPGPGLSLQRLAALGVNGPYFLHSGGATERKNLRSLAEAWKLVRRERADLQLVLAGPPDARRSQAFASTEGAVLTGMVSFEDLVGLVRGAAGVVVPSVYEGFGLPAANAMACGTPVVAAARTSLVELCEGVAVMVEPDPQGIATGILTAAGEGPGIARLVAAGLARAAEMSWQRCCAAHMSVYSELLGQGPGART